METSQNIIAEAPYRSVKTWLAPLTLMALLFFTQLLGESGREWLSYDRGLIEAGQWWRLITGSFVHLGWWHLFLNEMGLAVLVLLCPQPLSFAVWIRRLLILSLGMSLGLYFFVPSLNSYVGMSGVIHGLFLLGLVPQILKKDLIALGCLLYLIGKLAWELFSGAPVSDESALGGHVVLESHLFGTLTAFAYGIMFRVYKRTEIISLK
ncbi:rhombosortase [Stenotrophobium rhamnosiphilum]|nr:rhombosortase [Stenotrophobium rhamnosiphilum]